MAKVLTAIPATESNVKTLEKKEPFRSVRNDFCTCSWLAWFQHEGSRRRAGWGIYLRNPTQLWEPTKLEIHRNTTYSNSHRISSSTVYFATSNTVCPCFTLRASDHLDDFVIEIGLVRLVRLVRLVPVSSAPSCQALLEAHLPSFSLANNRCLACLGTWNADSDMIQPQVPLCSACDKGGPVTAFANDGSYWPNMGRFCPNFPTLGEHRKSMRTICYIIHQMPWAPRPSKIPGAKLAQKKIELQ